MRQGGHHHSIIGKKKWHVGRQENLDRVARDEARAADETRAKESQQRAADGDARLRALRAQVGLAPITRAGDDPDDAIVDHSGPVAAADTRGLLVKRSGVKPHPEYEAEQKKKEARDRKAAGVPDWKFSDMVSAPAWYMRPNTAPAIAPDRVLREDARKSLLDPLAVMQEYLRADRAAAEALESDDDDDSPLPALPSHVSIPLAASADTLHAAVAASTTAAGVRADEPSHHVHSLHSRRRSRDDSRYDDDDARGSSDRRERRHRHHSSSRRRSRSRSSERHKHRHSRHEHRHHGARHRERSKADERFVDDDNAKM